MRSASRRARSCPGPSAQPPSPYYMQVLGSLARAYDFDLDTPWGELREEARHVILRGTGGRPVTLRFVDGKKSYEVKKPFEGVIGNLERRMLSTESAWMREELSQLPGRPPVRDLRRRPPPARAAGVKIAGEDISLSSRRSVADALAWFSTARPAAHPAAERDRPAPSSRRSTSASASSTMSGSITSTSTAPVGTLQRRREPAHPPRQSRSAPASRACSTSSTSRRSASTRRTMTGSSKRSSACAASATPCWWSSMTRTRSAPPTMSSTWAPAPASMAAKWSAPARSTTCSPARTASPPTISPAAATSRCARQRRKGTGKKLTVHGARENNLRERHRVDPARHLHLRHRRLGQRQVVADHRHALRRRRPLAERRAHHRRQA